MAWYANYYICHVAIFGHLIVLAIPRPLRHVQFPLTSFSFCHDFIFFCQGLIKFGHQTRQLFLQILANRHQRAQTLLEMSAPLCKISRLPCLQIDSHTSLPCAFTMAVTSLCLSLAFSRVSAASCETDPRNMTHSLSHSAEDMPSPANDIEGIGTWFSKLRQNQLTLSLVWSDLLPFHIKPANIHKEFGVAHHLDK